VKTIDSSGIQTINSEKRVYLTSTWDELANGTSSFNIKNGSTIIDSGILVHGWADEDTAILPMGASTILNYYVGATINDYCRAASSLLLDTSNNLIPAVHTAFAQNDILN